MEKVDSEGMGNVYSVKGSWMVDVRDFIIRSFRRREFRCYHQVLPINYATFLTAFRQSWMGRV